MHAGYIASAFVLFYPTGLFTRAISNSGFALAHWSFIRKPKEQSEIFAKKLGCPTQSTHEMVECLQKVSSYRIAELFRGNHDVLHPRLDVFAPTIESGSPNDNDTETFLSEHPRELLRRGEIISKVPMINGANSHEGLIYAGCKKLFIYVLMLLCILTIAFKYVHCYYSRLCKEPDNHGFLE